MKISARLPSTSPIYHCLLGNTFAITIIDPPVYDLSTRVNANGIWYTMLYKECITGNKEEAHSNVKFEEVFDIKG